MKRMMVFSWVVVAAVLVTGNVHALDCDAQGIEWVTADFNSYRDMDTLRAVIGVETGLHNEDDWALLFSAGGGSMNLKEESVVDNNLSIWCINAGVKNYLTVNDSVSLLAVWERSSSGELYEAAGGLLAFKHRFIEAAEAVSPFIGLNGGLQSVKGTLCTDTESDKFNALVARITVGCDFKLREDSVLGVEGSRSSSWDTSDFNQGDYADGYGASVVFKYFWN